MHYYFNASPSSLYTFAKKIPFEPKKTAQVYPRICVVCKIEVSVENRRIIAKDIYMAREEKRENV